jgi:phospholipase C
MELRPASPPLRQDEAVTVRGASTHSARRVLLALVVAALAVLGGCSTQAAPTRTSTTTTTGPSSTTPSPASAPASAAVTKLLVFVVENHSLDEMREGMPNTYAVAQRYGYADHYFALTHPSLPNYIAMVSGDLHGVVDDSPPSKWQLSGPTIFGRALAAGRTATAYADAMPDPCHSVDAQRYAVRHNPWTYFVDERDACRTFDRPLEAFDSDVSAGDLPNAGYVAPDLCHDAHDCSLAEADSWFGAQLTKIFAGPDWRSGHLAVVLTADEDDRHNDNNVMTVVIHPSQQHNVVSERFDHYALYGLYEDVLGLPHTEARPASPSMAEAFGLPLG